MSRGLLQQGYQLNTVHKALHTIPPNLMEFKVIQNKIVFLKTSESWAFKKLSEQSWQKEFNILILETQEKKWNKL